MLENPIDQFIEWYTDAKNCSSIEIPEAMSFSTINDGCPDSRILLLKHVDKKGFVFFTNYQSSKGKDLTVRKELIENDLIEAVLFFPLTPQHRPRFTIRDFTDPMVRYQRGTYLVLFRKNKNLETLRY